MKSKLAVCGAAGKMGKRIVALALDEGQFCIAAAIEQKNHPDIGKDAGTIAAVEPIDVKLSAEFPKAVDAVIDFSSADSIDNTIDYCLKTRTPLVVGTTGLSKEQSEKLNSASSQIPLIYGTNMSVGMNTLFALVGKVAAMLGEDYDIEIIEEHHRFKKDAPSGSALTLAQNICSATGKKFPDSLVYGRQGSDTQRKKGTIGIHAVRAGDIVGIHSIIFSTLGETVTINHNAHNRDTFAKGALRAAKWLIGKKPGIYTMADCLGINKKSAEPADIAGLKLWHQ